MIYIIICKNLLHITIIIIIYISFQDFSYGIDVCLVCFAGTCEKHAALHSLKTGHSIRLNIKRTKQPEQKPQNSLEIPLEVFTFQTTAKCNNCILPTDSFSEIAAQILKTDSGLKQMQISAWREDLVECIHTKQIQPQPTKDISNTCDMCEIESDLWFCLQCGLKGCGRRQYGGN